MKHIYLDNAATTKVDTRVAKAMEKYQTEIYGNASSVHFMGQEAKRALEEARDVIAKAIGANRKELIFTGSGTESNNMVIKGLFWVNKEKNHIITTKIEHDCILKACKWIESKGGSVTYLDVDKEGFVNLEQLENSISEKILLAQTINSSIIVLLIILNSFWMLYVFNSILRIRSLLRELNFNLTRKPNR